MVEKIVLITLVLAILKIILPIESLGECYFLYDTKVIC